MLGGYNFKEYFKYEGSPGLKKILFPPNPHIFVLLINMTNFKS